MEPRGCNPWQSAANRPKAETARTSEIHCHRLHRLRATFHGKEGVDGSSPSEGSAKAPQSLSFLFRIYLRIVQLAVSMEHFMETPRFSRCSEPFALAPSTLK